MFRNYLKIAFKVLMRRKFFTFISLFGIAATLVVLTVAVAILDHVFGPQPPELNADRSLTAFTIRMDTPEGFHRYGPAGYGFLDRSVRTMPGVEAVTLHSLPLSVVSYVNGERITSNIKHTDAAFWYVTRFKFLEGQPFTEEDDRNARFVAVISASTRRKFFGDGPAVGRWIELDARRYQVVGTVEDVSMLRMVSYADVWVPIGAAKTDSYRHEGLSGSFLATVLAHERADFPAIKSEYASRLAQVEIPQGFVQVDGSLDTPFESLYHNLLGGISDDTGPELLAGLLFGLAILFMTLPAVNLVNINVSRMLERSSEIGVRRAFGASSRSLIHQFLIENVVLCLIGGLTGFVFSYGVLYLISQAGLIPYATFTPNLRVFGLGLLLSIVFALISGVYPAWRMARLHPVEALKRNPL